MTPGFRALIVDDDEISRDVTAAILRRLGATEVAEAADGPAALAWADADGGKLDLVVCDLRMPQLDGLETLDGLALRTYPRLFVLASGADPRVLRAASGAASGAASRIPSHRLRVVGKPMTLEKMQEIVDLVTQAPAPAEPSWDLLQTTPPDCSTAMVRGLSHGEFMPFFQPKRQIGTGRVAGVEALWRWHHPTYGVLAPASFIGVAQSVGLLGDIFFAVLPKVVVQCAEWRSAGHDIGVSIDIPPVLLTSADLPRKLEAAVTLFGLAPEHVTFEVTEDAWLQEKGIAREVLTRLRLRGFGLAIDGFGTGFSTIKQLIDAPFNEMKLDPILINMAPADREMTIALSSYVAVAHQLDMTIVADSLETAAQEAFAAISGCDQIQGPWIAPPMSAHELAHWLDQHRTIADPQPAAVCA